MSCTVAAIVSLLGYMPPKGTVISVPASQVQKYSNVKIAAAKACANRYGIKWQIVDDGAGR